MMCLPKSLTSKIYLDDHYPDLAVITGSAIFNIYLWIPLAFGLWFHSWWIWFLNIILRITTTTLFSADHRQTLEEYFCDLSVGDYNVMQAVYGHGVVHSLLY